MIKSTCTNNHTAGVSDPVQVLNLQALTTSILTIILVLAAPLSCANNTARPADVAQTTGEQTGITLEQIRQRHKQHDPMATRMLGDAYLSGQGVERNPEKAFALYGQAARAGDQIAQLHMGKSYHRGEGTDANQISAWVWLTLASEGDSPVKDQALALRKTVSVSLSNAQQERAKILTENFRQLSHLQTR